MSARRTGGRRLLSLSGSVLILSGLLPVAAAAPVLAASPITLSTINAAYIQDFNTLASSGTSTVAPAGWEFAESGTNANLTYTAGTGSSNTGDTYSFGATGSTERAFGGLRSGSLVPLIGAAFSNGTGFTLTSLDIAYTGEHWRLGQNTAGRSADRLDVQISFDATSLTTGTWTDANGLDFSSPVVAGTIGALNGNVSPNRTAVSGSIGGLTIPSGATFWIRWADTDLIPGADDGLAVDDLSVTPRAVDGAPAVASTTPSNGATDVARNSTLSITFNEPVAFTADGFSLTCATSGAHPATLAGGPTTWTIDPTTDFTYGESCTLTIGAAAVTDADGNDPPDQMVADAVITFTVEIDTCTLPYTHAYSIQGSGATTPIPGAVTTQGVVVGDYEGNSPAGLRGFYLQDATGDGDPTTSDAVFVFESDNANRVEVGDVVRVNGTATEFQGQTQVNSTNVRSCGTGSVVPVDVNLPQASATAFEVYEGMLVRLPQTLTVTEHFQLGRFGQVVVSSGGRLWTPTAVAEPGPDAQAVAAANLLNRLIVDDELQNQNPDPIRFGRAGNPLSASNTLRVGDTMTGVRGVMTYTWAGNAASGNAFRVRPVRSLGGSVPPFAATNDRPAPPSVGGSLHVGAMNVLNYFTTLDTTSGTGPCGPTGGLECRGANTAAELARQRAKIIEAMAGLDADIIGLMELQNDADVAIADLVAGLRARTGNPAWDFIHTGTIGTDAIKVGIIYDAAVATPAGPFAVLDTSVDSRFLDTKNRPSLAQTFDQVAGGGRLTVVVNHLKSKGSACDDVGDPDTGDGSGHCNGTRTAAARALVDWIATDPTNSGDRDVLVIGDLNSYTKEAPIDVFVNAGYQNVIERFGGAHAYSYVFDGQTGYLDHALASPTLAAQLAGAAEWHVNADEPGVLDYNTEFKSAGQVASLYAPDAFRSSDHDPLVVGMDLLHYAFSGYQAPIDNAPVVNSVKSGQAVPVKFSLGGDRGLDILFGGPTSAGHDCESDAPTDVLETEAAGGSGLAYDPATDTYTYVWKTATSWAGTCRTLELTFRDGTYRTAEFVFRR